MVIYAAILLGESIPCLIVFVLNTGRICTVGKVLIKGISGVRIEGRRGGMVEREITKTALREYVQFEALGLMTYGVRSMHIGNSM